MRYRSRNFSIIWPIIGLNFVLLLATFIDDSLIYRLGLQPASVLDRPWTLFTNLFIHAGFWHLLANMITFYFFGGYLSQLLKWKRLLVIYFGAGLLGNIFYVTLASGAFFGLGKDPYAIAVGASGAVFGLGGALAVIVPRLKVFIFPIPVPLPLWLAVIGGCLVLSFFPGIAWQAHLGGLVFGAVAGYLFRRARYY